MNIVLRKIKTVLNNPSVIVIYGKRYFGIIKMYLAYCLMMLGGKHIKKDIWLVSEKGTEARDNGYWFYRYVKQTHPEIKIFFVIKKDAVDSKKIERNEIVQLQSFRHFLYCLTSKVNVNSQAFGAIPKPPEFYFPIFKRLRRKDQVLVFLQHGVTKDELTHSLNYSNSEFDFVCCAAPREREFIQKTYGYPDDNVKTVGLCRFDNLLNEHELKKQILIMPTHRMWLDTLDTSKNANQKEKTYFEKTDFYMEYSSLLVDEKFVNTIQEEGYKVVFYLHYALQPYLSCFEKYANDSIIIANRDCYDVQQLLLESAVLITDYSSVFFDFAYMEKPELFYQFDEEKYRSEHFKKGYFDYSSDGFGPVLKRKDEVVHEIKRLLKNGCIMDELYKNRVDKFFSVRDRNNCQRVFDAIYGKAMMK